MTTLYECAGFCEMLLSNPQALQRFCKVPLFLPGRGQVDLPFRGLPMKYAEASCVSPPHPHASPRASPSGNLWGEKR